MSSPVPAPRRLLLVPGPSSIFKACGAAPPDLPLWDSCFRCHSSFFLWSLASCKGPRGYIKSPRDTPDPSNRPLPGKATRSQVLGIETWTSLGEHESAGCRDDLIPNINCTTNTSRVSSSLLRRYLFEMPSNHGGM